MKKSQPTITKTVRKRVVLSRFSEIFDQIKITLIKRRASKGSIKRVVTVPDVLMVMYDPL